MGLSALSLEHIFTSSQNQVVFLHWSSHSIQTTADKAFSMHILTHSKRYMGGVRPVWGTECGLKWHSSIHPFHISYALGESALQADSFW